MTYSIKAEEIKSGWLFNVTGGFDGSNTPQYHNKKAKIAVLDMQVALQKALKQLNIIEYQYSLEIETLADKQAVIDFYRKPIPKLFKKLEAEFLEHDDIYFNLLDENSIEINFSRVLIDLENIEHRISGKITNTQIEFFGENKLLRNRYKSEINRIINIVKA